MENDINWFAHIEITRRKHASRYAEFARINTQNNQMLRDELNNFTFAASEAGKYKLQQEALALAQWLWSEGGRFLDLQGYAEIGRQLLIQALDAARSLGDKVQEEQILGQLGRAWQAMGIQQNSSQCFQEALALAQKMGNRRSQASHLGCLGSIYLDQGKGKEAQECFQQALELAGSLGDKQLEGRLLASLGTVYLQARNPTRAIEYFNEALGMARKTGDWQGEASHLGCLGAACEILGYEREQRRYTIDLEFTNEYIEPIEQVQRERYDHFSRAVGYFEKALAIAEKHGDMTMQVRFKSDLKRSRANQLGAQARLYDNDVPLNIRMRNQPPSR